MASQISPVVLTESHFAGAPQHLHVEVSFQNAEELDALINALTQLRDTVGDEFDHIHLQHYEMPKSSQIGYAEIVFFRPGRAHQGNENEMIDEAKTWIKEAAR